MTRTVAPFDAFDFALKVDDWTDEELIASFHGLYASWTVTPCAHTWTRSKKGFDRANCIHQKRRPMNRHDRDTIIAVAQRAHHGRPRPAEQDGSRRKILHGFGLPDHGPERGSIQKQPDDKL